MTDYHTVYKGNEEDTTKWDDLQRKLGNLPAKAPVWKPEAYAPEEEEQRGTAWLDGKSAEELEELEEEVGDDRFLAEYRRKRLVELRKGPQRPRFGTLEEIRRSDWVAQVTQAPAGVWVVCHLYKDSVQGCCILNQCLAEVAKDYPATKFVKIVSTECIAGYPDDNLPTVLLYRDGKCAHTLVGLRHFGGASTSPELVAISLNRHGEVCGDAEHQEQQVRDLVSRLLIQRQEGQERQGEDEDSDFD